MTNNYILRLNIGASQFTEDGKIEVVIKYNGDANKLAEQFNAVVEVLSDNYAIVSLNVDLLPLLYDNEQVEYVELPKILTFLSRATLIHTCVTSVQSESGFDLRGKGVIVGIIDSGIDFTHPDFINDDNTSRILYLWDQSTTGNPPEGFRSGTEFSNSQLNEAINSSSPFDIVNSSDFVGHGTAVAGVAASNGRTDPSRVMGIAPESSLIVVKLGRTDVQGFARSTEIMRAVKYIIDKARTLNMPVAINISYGTNNGSHSGDTLFEEYINSVSNQWKTVICVATGNEGVAAHHFFYNIKNNETINVQLVTSGGINRIFMSLWKDFADSLIVELVAPSGQSSGPVRPSQSFTRFTTGGIDVSIILGQPTHYNQFQEMFFYAESDIQLPTGIWRLIITGENVVNGDINIWLPTLEEVTSVTSFSNPSTDITLTIPSTALKVISVGGYNSHINASADFSGRGFTRANIYTKPDLVAPAVNIVTTKAGGGYGNFTGTSFAAPYITGAAAIMMEWGIVRGNDRFLYGQRVKSFLHRGANRKASIVYPNNIWGYGSLSLCDTMNLLIEFNRGGISF